MVPSGNPLDFIGGLFNGFFNPKRSSTNLNAKMRSPQAQRGREAASKAPAGTRVLANGKTEPLHTYHGPSQNQVDNSPGGATWNQKNAPGSTDYLKQARANISNHSMPAQWNSAYNKAYQESLDKGSANPYSEEALNKDATAGAGENKQDETVPAGYADSKNAADEDTAPEFQAWSDDYWDWGVDQYGKSGALSTFHKGNYNWDELTDEEKELLIRDALDWSDEAQYDVNTGGYALDKNGNVLYNENGIDYGIDLMVKAAPYLTQEARDQYNEHYKDDPNAQPYMYGDEFLLDKKYTIDKILSMDENELRELITPIAMKMARNNLGEIYNNAHAENASDEDIALAAAYGLSGFDTPYAYDSVTALGADAAALMSLANGYMDKSGDYSYKGMEKALEDFKLDKWADKSGLRDATLENAMGSHYLNNDWNTVQDKDTGATYQSVYNNFLLNAAQAASLGDLGASLYYAKQRGDAAPAFDEDLMAIAQQRINNNYTLRHPDAVDNPDAWDVRDVLGNAYLNGTDAYLPAENIDTTSLPANYNLGSISGQIPAELYTWGADYAGPSSADAARAGMSMLGMRGADPTTEDMLIAAYLLSGAQGTDANDNAVVYQPAHLVSGA